MHKISRRISRISAWQRFAILTAVLGTLSAASVGARFRYGDGGRPLVRILQTLQARVGGTVWVANRDLGELAIFDADTGTLLHAPLQVGAGAHDVCISERSHEAYVTAEAIHKVAIVDIRTLTVDFIDVGPLPHHCETSHDGETVYVSLASHTTTSGAPAVAIIDTHDHSVSYATTSANAGARAHGLFATSGGETLYVAHDSGDEVSGIDLDSGRILFSVHGISRAEEPIATRFGNWLWVSARGDNSLKRVNLDTHRIDANVEMVGVQPESVMLTPSERTLVMSLRGSPASLAFVDTGSLRSRGTVALAGEGTFGNLAVMAPGGRYVFATFDALANGTGGVAIVDVETRRRVGSWKYPGLGRPHGIAYTKRRPRR